MLRHCTRKTFATISSALQFASAYQTTNKTIGFLISKCVTPQTNKFLCVRTTENAFVLFANLLFKTYKTVNRQYKRNILHFYTTVNKLLFPVYEAMKNLQTLQQELRIHCKKKYNFCPLKGTKPQLQHDKTKKSHFKRSEIFCFCFNYLMILETTPDPTVWPPSRIAKRRPSSIAMGVINVTLMWVWSPGITISTPSSSSIVPVTSVVRK